MAQETTKQSLILCVGEKCSSKFPGLVFSSIGNTVSVYFFLPRVASQSQSYKWLWVIFAFSWFFGRKVALVVLKLSAEKWCWDCCSAIILIAVLDLKSIFSLVFLWMSWRQQQIVALVTCFSSSLWIFYDTLRCWKVVLCEKWPTFFRTW